MNTRRGDVPLKTATCPKCGTTNIHTDLGKPEYRSDDGKQWYSCDNGHYFTRRAVKARR